MFGRTYGYQFFFSFCLMLNSLILHNNKRATNWISTELSLEKLEPFDTNLAPTMANLPNGRVRLQLSFKWKRHVKL